MTDAFDAKENIFERMKEFLVSLFDIPEGDITMDADLAEDLDLDSIDAVDLMVKIQELTGKKISPEEFKSVRTVRDVIDRVHALVAEGAA